MSKFLRIFLSAVLVLSAVSCNKATRDAAFATQETHISSYISTEVKSGATFVENGGVYRIVYDEGTGDALQSNGVISFYYAAYVFSGSKSISNMIATNHKETAASAGWDTTDESRYQVLTVALDESDFVEGLKTGLVGVKAGQHASIVFSGRHGFGDKIYGKVPANSALLYEIWVVAVTN